MTGPCHSANHETGRGCEKPCLGADDGRLEILGKSSASSEPRESGLDDPSPREHLEPFGCIRPLDDFNGPSAEIGQRPRQLFSSVSAVSEQMAQPRVKLANGGCDACGRTGLAPQGNARHGYQREVDRPPQAAVPPGIEVTLNRRDRRKPLRQRPPLAAGPGDIEQRVHNRPEFGRSRSSRRFRVRHERCDQRPFPIRQRICATRPRTVSIGVEN